MAKLTAQDRRDLPKSDFAIKSKSPGSGSYPLPDASHARSALSFVSRYGSPAEKEKVRSAVAKRFGEIKQSK